MSIFQRVLRAGEGKRMKELQAVVDQVNALEPELEQLSDERTALNARTGSGSVSPPAKPSTTSRLRPTRRCREAAKRVLGQRPYDVQIIGGATMHRGHDRRDEDR